MMDKGGAQPFSRVAANLDSEDSDVGNLVIDEPSTEEDNAAAATNNPAQGPSGQTCSKKGPKVPKVQGAAATSLAKSSPTPGASPAEASVAAAKGSESSSLGVPPKKRLSKVGKAKDGDGTKSNGMTSPREKQFNQVEDALEAMFAGVGEGDQGSSSASPHRNNVHSKQEAPKTTAAHSDPQQSSGPSSKKAPSKKPGRKPVDKGDAAKKPPQRRKSLPSSATSEVPLRKKPGPKPGQGRRNGGKAKVNGIDHLKEPSTRKAPNGGSSSSTKQEELLERFKGPFVRVAGTLDNPTFVNVVNGPMDALNAAEQKRKAASAELDIRVRAASAFGGAGNHQTSTLSNLYDSKIPDESWVCIFCSRGSHHEGLGDLFGPYFISRDIVGPSPSNHNNPISSAHQDLAAKFILGGEGGSSRGRKRKRKLSATHPDPESPGKGHHHQAEVWFHEDCLCWMSGIQLVGNVILGLEEAVESSQAAQCSRCHRRGSTLACVALGCRETAHFPCARSWGWSVDEQLFHAKCLKHR